MVSTVRNTLLDYMLVVKMISTLMVSLSIVFVDYQQDYYTVLTLSFQATRYTTASDMMTLESSSTFRENYI